MGKGVAMPDVLLPATDGTLVNPGHVGGWAVYFIYPYTGRPGVPDPAGWDKIVGAHGSTPQALAYSNRYDQFCKRNIKIFGVSFQDGTWQQEFVARTSLQYSLLSDAAKEFATALALETFTAGDRTFLKRRTLITRQGIVQHDRRVVSVPADDAADVLSWFREQGL